MATYLAPFELRRLLVKFNRQPSGGTTEDADVCSFHFAKLTGGAVDANWLAADYTAVETRFDTWWTAVKAYYPATTLLAEYRWYKSGPVFEPADRAAGPPNPSERTTIRAVIGTAAVLPMLPPQIAMSITTVVPIRKRWGRFYLPAPSATGGPAAPLTTDGRINGTSASSILGSTVTCFNGCRTDGKQPVVFSRGRSAYVTGRGEAIPDHPVAAYEITSLQMDNLFDVIRSRRYDGPTARFLTALT